MESSRKPFMFDHSFDPGAVRAEEEKSTTAAPVFTEADMASARQEGFQQGQVEGRAAASQEINQMQTSMLQRVELLLSRLAEDVWKVYAEQKQTASEIAMVIARKLLPDFTKRNGMQEMTAAIESAVTEMINEPRLVLRVPDAQFDFFSREVNTMAGKLGFGGKIIVLADPALSEHDCRIEWADGGMERNTNFTWSEIERQVSRHAPSIPQNTATLPPGETPSPSVTNIAV